MQIYWLVGWLESCVVASVVNIYILGTTERAAAGWESEAVTI